METQRGLLRRPAPLTGWGVSIAAPKGMRRAPRRVRLRVISNGGVAPKPPGKKLLTRGFGGLGAPAFRKFGPFYFVGAGFLAGAEAPNALCYFLNAEKVETRRKNKRKTTARIPPPA